MTKELCGICTGSYTGEFSPKWRGPWATYFDASGTYIPAESAGAGGKLSEREERLRELRAQNRLPLGQSYGRYGF